MVTMYSVGPTKARQQLSLLTARASGARSAPRATTLPTEMMFKVNHKMQTCVSFEQDILVALTVSNYF